MTYHGHIQNGQITLDEPVELLKGSEVSVEILKNGEGEPSIWDKLLELAGTVKGPKDWAHNHDHYLYGTSKRR